jgi:hypothetical protein
VTTTKVKLSGPMFEALNTFRQNNTAILPASWIRTGTAVALMQRGLISTQRYGRYQLLPAGARQLSIDYTIFIDRAYDAAVAEDADRVVCIVPGCDEVFTSGVRFTFDESRTGTERMRLHVAAAHVPTSVIGWVQLHKPLTDEQWKIARTFVLGVDETETEAPADSAKMVITASGQRKIAEAVARNAPESTTVGETPAPKPTTEDLLLGLAEAARDGMPVGTGLSFTYEGGLSVQLTRDSVDQLYLWAGYLNAPVVDGGKIKNWRHWSVNGTLRGHPVEVWTAQY